VLIRANNNEKINYPILPPTGPPRKNGILKKKTICLKKGF